MPIPIRIMKDEPTFPVLSFKQGGDRVFRTLSNADTASGGRRIGVICPQSDQYVFRDFGLKSYIRNLFI